MVFQPGASSMALGRYRVSRSQMHAAHSVQRGVPQTRSKQMPSVEGLIKPIKNAAPIVEVGGTSMHLDTLKAARERFERDYIAAVIAHHRGRIADAARTLGIQRTNLYRKARQLGFSVARRSSRS